MNWKFDFSPDTSADTSLANPWEDTDTESNSKAQLTHLGRFVDRFLASLSLSIMDDFEM